MNLITRLKKALGTSPGSISVSEAMALLEDGAVLVDARSLRGGMNAWTRAGRPVTR